MRKRRKEQQIPFSIPPPATSSSHEVTKLAMEQDEKKKKQRPATDYTSIVDSGIRWMLVLAFIILVLIAVEEISIVVFGRQPSQYFTPTLISALTGIIGGILFFFRVLVKHYRNHHNHDSDTR